MKLANTDMIIILLYLAATIFVGFWLSKKANKNLNSYFLAGKDIPWYYLGLSNASGMFDVSGTMIAVAWLFVYGLKSAWIPWLWPVWNQIFMMVFLAVWMRRSNVMTGAEWISFRFGNGLGGRLSHIVTVIFAIIIVITFMSYFVVGIGKFAVQFLPWDLSFQIGNILIPSENGYAFAIIGITTLYTMKGGFYSVVGTEILQFIIMTIACIIVGIIAIMNTTPEQIAQAVPANWDSLWFSWELDLDWSALIPAANNRITEDGYSLFGFLFILMLFKGVFASLAGPVPSYDMQRVLSTKTPIEAAKMFGLTPIVLTLPRYFMIAGITVLALVFMDTNSLMDSSTGILDFEQVLPYTISEFIPTGLKGLLLAGLLAAFMSTFAAFINAGSAYVVNDIYKRYINDSKNPKFYVGLSYIVTLLLVIIGVTMGLKGGNIQARTDWIIGLLYGSYVASNVLKWIWWRFNGYGFFFGMLAGMAALIFLPKLLEAYGYKLLAIEQFPILLVISTIGSIVGCLLTKPTNMQTLKDFYSKTRPWGFWQPVLTEVQKDHPDFLANKDFKRDSINIIIGIVWQMTLVVIPIYIILRKFDSLSISLVLLLLTSIFLKKNWYNKLRN